MRRGCGGQKRPGLLAALLAGLLLLWASAEPGRVLGQAGDLQVVIDQPGVGETYYTGPDGPRTLVPITGRVIGGDFDPTQVEIQLELLQDGSATGMDVTTPDAGGMFIFRVMINANGSAELSTPESNCFTCHELARLTVPAGIVTVRVTAVEPTGGRAVAERQVAMDRAGVATVTVQVRVAGEGSRAAPGLPVEARTLVYDWRGRKFTALTDEQGKATMQVEALALRPTHYRLNMAPILLDDILYQTVAPVEFELAPGDTSAGPIDVTVAAQLGRLSGSVALPAAVKTAPASTLTVSAIELPYGRSFSGPVTNGRFSLSGLPVGQYLVGLDREQMAALGLQMDLSLVDFGSQNNAACSLELTTGTGHAVRGRLIDATGMALPLGWITADGQNLLAQSTPNTGAFAVFDVPAGLRTLRAAAPGYWSRTIPARTAGFLNVQLESKPGTRHVAWGTGSLVLPDATIAVANGDSINLQRGWLWGQGDKPLTITTAEAEITIERGAFALEYLPGESAWLYLMAGQAAISRGSGPPATLIEGQMFAFAGKEIVRLVPASLYGTAVTSLGTRRPMPVAFEAKPGFWTGMQNALAGVGVLDVNPVAATVSLLGVAAFVSGTVLIAARRKARHPHKSSDSVPEGEQ